VTLEQVMGPSRVPCPGGARFLAQEVARNVTVYHLVRVFVRTNLLNGVILVQ